MGGKVALKIGQIGADTEFLVSQYAEPVRQLDLRLARHHQLRPAERRPGLPRWQPPASASRLAPDGHWTLLTAVFDDNPAGARTAADDPQKLDRYGTNFRVTDAPLLISEAAYSYGDKDGTLLPGIAKLGGWEDFGSFAASIPTGSRPDARLQDRPPARERRRLRHG